MDFASEDKKQEVAAGAGDDAIVTTEEASQPGEAWFSRVSVWLMLIFMSIATASDS